MDLRLTLIAHAATQATRAAVFSLDEPLTPQDAARAAALAKTVDRADSAWTSPALRAVQTAQALALDAEVEPLLADLNLGAWAGKTLAQAEAEDAEALALWMHDPECAPHGGESVTHLLKRVADWLARVSKSDGRVVAVTHSAVIRAAALIALDAPMRSFWRIDVAPLSLSRFFARNGRWTVRCLNEAMLKND